VCGGILLPAGRPTCSCRAPWGPHACAVFGVFGLAIAYSTHRRNNAGLVSPMLRPVFGKLVDGWFGKMIDIFAIIATLFGKTTSLGLGASQIGEGVDRVFGIPSSLGQAGVEHGAPASSVLAVQRLVGGNCCWVQGQAGGIDQGLPAQELDATAGLGNEFTGMGHQELHRPGDCPVVQVTAAEQQIRYPYRSDGRSSLIAVLRNEDAVVIGAVISPQGWDNGRKFEEPEAHFVVGRSYGSGGYATRPQQRIHGTGPKGSQPGIKAEIDLPDSPVRRPRQPGGLDDPVGGKGCS
jgi:hypothetical protein